MPYSYSSLIQRISYDNDIVDLTKASDQAKLKVYGLTFKHIQYSLRKEDLLIFPQAALMEFNEAVREIIDSFFELRRSDIVYQFDLNHVMPIISTANSHLLATLSILNNEGKTFEYFEELQDFREFVFQVCEYLEVVSQR